MAKPISKAKKLNQLPEIGAKLKTKKKILPIEECVSFFVHNKHLVTRKPNCKGEYIGYVPGAGGDVWFVKHEDNTVAAYQYTEVMDL